MNTHINKTKWKCRRGLRELDLLFRKFSGDHLETLSKEDFDMFNSILDLEDQPLYDFILQHIKKFLKQWNYFPVLLSNYWAKIMNNNHGEGMMVEQIKAGNSKAFEAMVIQYQPKLLSSMIAYTKSYEQA